MNDTAARTQWTTSRPAGHAAAIPESLHIEMGSGAQPVETHPGRRRVQRPGHDIAGDSREIASRSYTRLGLPSKCDLILYAYLLSRCAHQPKVIARQQIG